MLENHYGRWKKWKGSRENWEGTQTGRKRKPWLHKIQGGIIKGKVLCRSVTDKHPKQWKGQAERDEFGQFQKFDYFAAFWQKRARSRECREVDEEGEREKKLNSNQGTQLRKVIIVKEKSYLFFPTLERKWHQISRPLINWCKIIYLN